MTDEHNKLYVPGMMSFDTIKKMHVFTRCSQEEWETTGNYFRDYDEEPEFIMASNITKRVDFSNVVGCETVLFYDTRGKVSHVLSYVEDEEFISYFVMGLESFENKRKYELAYEVQPK